MTLSVAGAIQEEEVPRLVSEPSETNVRMEARYEPPTDSSYVATFEPAASRLFAVVRPTETGFVASVAALNAIGYGDRPETAVDDLANSVRQYLEFLRTERPVMAPEVVRHMDYIRLLDVPRGSWFAWVRVHATPLE